MVSDATATTGPDAVEDQRATLDMIDGMFATGVTAEEVLTMTNRTASAQP